MSKDMDNLVLDEVDTFTLGVPYKPKRKNKSYWKIPKTRIKLRMSSGRTRTHFFNLRDRFIKDHVEIHKHINECVKN